MWWKVKWWSVGERCGGGVGCVVVVRSSCYFFLSVAGSIKKSRVGNNEQQGELRGRALEEVGGGKVGRRVDLETTDGTSRVET